MGVKYVKVEGRKSECPCSITTEKGILWEYVDDKYRHFQTLCGPCVEDLFGSINMFKLPVVTPEQVTEIRPESRMEEDIESDDSPQVIDLLANLASRVNSLEQQLRDTQRNVERQAEELATLRYLGASNEEDIAMLDERSQVLNAIQKYYGGAGR
jgi:hypothetical protein